MTAGSRREVHRLQTERAARRRAEVLDAALGIAGEKGDRAEGVIDVTAVHAEVTASAQPGPVPSAETTLRWPEDGDGSVGLEQLLAAAGAARTHHHLPPLPEAGLAKLRAAAMAKKAPGQVARQRRSFVRVMGAATAAAAMLVVGVLIGSSTATRSGRPPAPAAQVQLHTVAQLIAGARKALASAHPATADSLLNEAAQLATSAGPAPNNSSDAMAAQLARDQNVIAQMQAQLDGQQSAKATTTTAAPAPPPPTTAAQAVVVNGPPIIVSSPTTATDAAPSTTVEQTTTSTTSKSTTTTTKSTTTTTKSATTTTPPTSSTVPPTTTSVPTATTPSPTAPTPTT